MTIRGFGGRLRSSLDSLVCQHLLSELSHMSNVAIRAEGLGKRYRIGTAGRQITKLREGITHVVTAPVRNFVRLRRLSAFGQGDENDVVWALRDASFTLRHGEVLGIIGHNGAGKSTLLKILSRITRPTVGRAELEGRVGSLLEVGTGFHPELTGRDNIFLNGSILGMDRRYMKRRFDEIVDFSGVGKFIDTPVKRYSSGMFVRLAFAVAAHLEPEILIVDEVLAVGDAEFQSRCLGKMGDVARDGRTVLFVSHNLGAIQRLCTRAVLLDRGRIVADGDTHEIVERYVARAGADAPAGSWLDLGRAERSGTGAARIVALHHTSGRESIGLRPYPGGPLDLTLRLQAHDPVPRLTIGFTLKDNLGMTLVSGSTKTSGARVSLPQGISNWRISIASLPLRPGHYQLDLWIGDAVDIHDRLPHVAQLEVIDLQTRALGSRHDSLRDGPVYCDYRILSAESDRPGKQLEIRSAAVRG
jgi:lipopolysaccharide transport system ATP-binding protein